MTIQKQNGNAILVFIIALLIGAAGTLYILRLKAPELW